MRNPYMVAEQEFRTTTPEPASQLSSETVSRTATPGSEPSEDDGSSPPSMEQSEAAAPATPSLTTTKCTQEMLENATLLTQFGKEDTAAKSQSHAARIQVTLENAEITEIKCAVFRALTRLKSYRDERIRDAIDRIETQTTDENNETFRRETVSHEFRTDLHQSCMTKKKGKDARRAGAVNTALRADDTVETKPETACLLPRK